MERERVIIHVDMDAFYASVEQRDRPELRAKPVIIGSDPREGRGRGVVSAASYEARKFGVHSAQPISQAYRLCPQGVYLPVRMEAYEEASHEVRRIFEEFTPQIEPISIDEAFLDVTDSLHLFGAKRALAGRIQRRIAEQTRLTASLGVAPCKLVAKIASDLRKPCGLVIVELGEVEAFLQPLPVGKLSGVGKKTEVALAALGIGTIGDLADYDRSVLIARLGKGGDDLWELAHGRDERPVVTDWEAKSIGHEHTFEEDTRDVKLLRSTLMRLCEGVASRLREAGKRGRTVTTKVRFEGFVTLTRAHTCEWPVDTAPDIYRIALENLGRANVDSRRIRLIGVSVSGFEGEVARQTTFLTPPAEHLRARKQHGLGEVIDRVRQRFSEDALRQGRSLQRPRKGEVEGGRK
jgi:DNA polymerase IV